MVLLCHCTERSKRLNVQVGPEQPVHAVHAGPPVVWFSFIIMSKRQCKNKIII